MKFYEFKKSGDIKHIANWMDNYDCNNKKHKNTVKEWHDVYRYVAENNITLNATTIVLDDQKIGYKNSGLKSKYKTAIENNDVRNIEKIRKSWSDIEICRKWMKEVEETTVVLEKKESEIDLDNLESCERKELIEYCRNNNLKINTRFKKDYLISEIIKFHNKL